MLLLLAAPAVAGVARAPVDWTGWAYYYWDVRHGYFWSKDSGDPKWKDSGFYGAYRGALRFDLSALPDSQVFAVELRYRALAGHYSTPSVLTFCGTRFELLPAQTMWGDIGRGAVVGCDTFEYGWASRLLNAAGTALVDSMIAAGWFQVGVVSGGPNECAAYGYGAPESLRPYLMVWCGNVPDLAVLDASVATWPLVVGETETISVKVANVGTGTSATRVLYYEASCGSVSYSDTVHLAPISAGDTVAVGCVYSPGSVGRIGFRAWLSVSDSLDWNRANDSLDLRPWPECWVYRRGTYAAEGFDLASEFPPPGWAVINADSGSYTWQQSPAEYHHSRPHCAYCMDEPGAVMSDDWLTSPEVRPQSGHADSVGFFHRWGMPGRAESLAVYAIEDLGRQQVQYRLGNVIRFADTTWRSWTAGLDHLDGRSIRIGVRYMAGAGSAAMLDDFWLSRTPRSSIEEGPLVTEPGLPSLFPNPTRGRVQVAGTALGCWRLLDVAGRVVAEGNGPGGDIDLSRQRPGVYCLEAVTESGTSRTKLVRAE